MNRQPDNNIGLGGVAMGEAETTLRLIARLPAPDGLEDRVKEGLSRAPSRRIAAWPLSASHGWMQSSWIRGAAAAAIVALVAGGSWEVYSRVQPSQARIAIPHVGGSGGFSSANAMRTPKTLDVPTVTQSASPENKSRKKQADGKKKTPLSEHPSAVQPTAR
jgi:hypothetical protein